MDPFDIMRSKKLTCKNKEILFHVALLFNKELFDEGKISYRMFQYAEENILKEWKVNESDLKNF